MTVDLAALPPRCFQGVAPAVVATSSVDGVPNVTYVSQIHYLDPRRVAMSCQFFNKTRQNIDANPYACVQLYDPLTFEAYELDLRFDYAEPSGPLFDEMSMRIQAIASHTGMKGVFRLLSADVYEVLAVRKIEGFLGEDEAPLAPFRHEPGPPMGELRALQLVSGTLARAADLDDLVTSLLASLEDAMGFQHSMLLVPDESRERLFTLASRGYGESGVGAEVALGEGLVGVVAKERRILRLSDVERDLRYGRTVRNEVAVSSDRTVTAEIPLPGLASAQSHLGVPLVLHDRLVGVLAVESPRPLAFDEWHEAFLNVIANQAAFALDRMMEDESPAAPAPAPPSTAAPPSRKTRTFRFFKADDSVFVDDEYLIRNVAARILWRVLSANAAERRTEFTNRELRLDPWLGLPPVKDNLESRIILLRKRLEQKCPDVRIPSCSRGHFRLEADCAIALVEV